MDNSIDSELLPASVPLGGRLPDGTEQPAAPIPAKAKIPLLQAVREHAEVSGMLEMANEFLAGQGFTEHGFRHANLVGHIAFNVLRYLDFDDHTAELGAVAGYLHDIGNVVSRSQHGQSSGLIAFTILREMDVPIRDIAQIMGAAGNHEEQYGVAVSPVSAAVIVADKSDVHRSRVRESGNIEADIHDRVNYAVTSSFLRVSDRVETVEQTEQEQTGQGQTGTSAVKTSLPTRLLSPSKCLTLELEVDTTVTPVFEYFEIFMARMVMCRRAGQTLGAEFKITVNDVPVL